MQIGRCPQYATAKSVPERWIGDAAANCGDEDRHRRLVSVYEAGGVLNHYEFEGGGDSITEFLNRHRLIVFELLIWQ